MAKIHPLHHAMCRSIGRQHWVLISNSLGSCRIHPTTRNEYRYCCTQQFPGVDPSHMEETCQTAVQTRPPTTVEVSNILHSEKPHPPTTLTKVTSRNTAQSASSTAQYKHVYRRPPATHKHMCASDRW